MENLSEHLKENVTYINGLFENAMDYIEREFMVGMVPAALLTMRRACQQAAHYFEHFKSVDARENSDG